jgi:hypothetical protein
VRIHINRASYESPTPTTGAALYKLGNIGHRQELFRELDGDQEDQAVANDESPLNLTEDEHFYSEKDFSIVINGRKKTVTQTTLTFDQIVTLAFDTRPTGPNIVFTITYRNGPRKNPEGTLLDGDAVRIKNEMIFNVTATDKS